MKPDHPACAVSNCTLLAMSRTPGAFCAPHYAFQYRGGIDMEAFIPRASRRTERIEPGVDRRSLPREDPRIRNVICLQCGCGRPVWSQNSSYCHPHALEAAESGVRPELTGLCALVGCDSGRQRESLICHPHRQRAKRFSLTDQELIEILAPGACEMCGIEASLAIDHDHACCPTSGQSCGQCIRGLLCGPCNTFLGRIENNVDLIPRALEYLAKKVVG